MSARQEQMHRAAWGGILTAATVIGTFTMDCATPFAALATLAALVLPRRDAFMLIGVNWAVNQAIGFGLLQWPVTALIGGVELGIACMLCTAAAVAADAVLRRNGWTVTVLGAFVAAFVSFEGAFMVANLWQSHGEIGASVLLYMFYLNGIALMGLMLLQGAAMSLGLDLPRQTQTAGQLLAAA